METTTTPITASKSMRFDVLKRDNFTCRYCGRTAPEVMLEVDHYDPISNGGKATMSNLVTACYDCNRGKSDKVLIPKRSELTIAQNTGTAYILKGITRRIGPIDFLPDTIAAIEALTKLVGWHRADDLVGLAFEKCYGSPLCLSLSASIWNLIAQMADRKWRRGNISLPPCNLLCDVGEDIHMFCYEPDEDYHACDVSDYTTDDVKAWMFWPGYFVVTDGAE